MAGEKGTLGIWVGEPTLPPPTTCVSETYRDTTHERDLSLYQAAGDALTNAGLGTYRVALVELQPDPFTRRLVSDFTSYIPIAITLRNGDPFKLYDLVKRARGARQGTEQEGKRPEEVDQAVQVAIGIGITSYLEQLSPGEGDERPSDSQAREPQLNIDLGSYDYNFQINAMPENGVERTIFPGLIAISRSNEVQDRGILESPDARRLWQRDHARKGTVPPGYMDIDDMSESDINTALDAIAEIKNRKNNPQQQ